MDRQVYKNITGGFYFRSEHAPNPISRYYHSSRYKTIRSFVNSVYKKGSKILDIGSGGSVWNIGHLPVTGLDINVNFLEEGKKVGTISAPVIHDLRKPPIPLSDESFDIVVLSEVLEHMENYTMILKEAYRILKKGGHLVLTVPYDTVISPWHFLFSLQCFLKGNVLGDTYYKNCCGHVNHFSPHRLIKIVESVGFNLSDKNITLLNIALFLVKPK